MLLKNGNIGDVEIIDVFYRNIDIMLIGVLRKNKKWKEFQLRLSYLGDMVFGYELNGRKSMNHAQLKKFAIRSREKLLAVTDEKTAYTSFIRLCAVAFVRPQYMIQLRNMSAEERQSAFAEKCRELDGRYGGVFNTGGGDVEYPEVLLGDILADLPLSEMDRDDALGWAHQYFNEPYRESLAVGLKKSKRLNSDDIAPATQVFTPDWIVKYLVQNTLVRRWYEGGGAKLNGR